MHSDGFGISYMLRSDCDIREQDPGEAYKVNTGFFE